MIMSILALHGLLMAVDEFYFHSKRGLPRWERWGHPLDTLTVIIPTALLYFDQISSLYVYVSLAAFSCLFVTKDEWVHKEKCDSWETWLHSLLFVLHPVIFYSLWMINNESKAKLGIILIAQVAFIFYQIMRWNLWKKLITSFTTRMD